MSNNPPIGSNDLEVIDPMSENGKLPAKLAEIVADFAWCEGREKLELLLQYSERMPPLPPWLEEIHDRMDQVHECMTPVFIHAETRDQGIHFFFDVPRESPTVRGFAAILGIGLNGTAPGEILKIPNDFYYQMGLENVLTHQRLNGISAILAHIKRLAATELEKNQT
jgi:cysteine desulfuration protein SufE